MTAHHGGRGGACLLAAGRIDALAPEEKALLQDVAVIGKGFYLGAPAALADRGRLAAGGAALTSARVGAERVERRAE